MIRRRMFTAGVVASLAAPSVSRGAANAVLKFIPQSDLTVLDPIATTVYTARNHGYMVFDTLFGMDSEYQMQPQMLEGFSVEDDGRRWKLTLREGLLWHDSEKVLARDCIASIRRWAARDGVGGLMMARTDELAAIEDRTIQFRLKKPFGMLPYALGKISTPMCAMMPERLANTPHLARELVSLLLSAGTTSQIKDHPTFYRNQLDGIEEQFLWPGVPPMPAFGSHGTTVQWLTRARRRPGHTRPVAACPLSREGLIERPQIHPLRIVSSPTFRPSRTIHLK